MRKAAFRLHSNKEYDIIGCTYIISEAHVNNISFCKKIFSVLLAMLLGVCASGAIGVIIPSAMYLSAVSVFSSALLAFLFGFAGFLPAVTMAAVMLISGFAVGSWVIPAYLFVIGILPGAVMIYGSQKGLKFFSQVRNALIAELIAFVVLLGALRVLTGQDFASFFKTMFDEMISEMPEDAKDLFAEYLNQIINQQNASETKVNTENILSFLSDGMEQTLSLMMPVAMVMYSVLNGAVGVLWMNWLRRRHGEDNVQFVPLRGWRLSKQIILGLVIIFIAVIIIGNRMAEAGLSARLIAGTAIVCAACIQASASFLSRLAMMGVTVRRRTIFLFVFFFLSMVYFPIYGIMSALFGSKGLFAPKVRYIGHDGTPQKPEDDISNKNEDDNDKEDE